MAGLAKFFTLTIDGKKMGPFPESQREKFKSLLHLKGVELATVWLDDGECRRQKAEGRRQKAEGRRQKAAHPSLLDGLDWVAVPRMK